MTIAVFGSELTTNLRFAVATDDLHIDALGGELAEKLVVEGTAVAALKSAGNGR